MTLQQPLHPPVSHRAGNRQHWGHLHGPAPALAIVTPARAFVGLSLVITPDTGTALRLQSELRVFAWADPALPVLHLADWETLTYDNISPHQDIISERLEYLYRLPRPQKGLLVVTNTAATQPLMAS